MRKWPIIWGSSLFLGACLYALIVAFQIPYCKARYEGIVTQMSFSPTEENTKTQNREGVTKQLIMQQDDQRVHYAMSSELSSFEWVDGPVGVIERCSGVSGFQEEVDGKGHSALAQEMILYFKQGLMTANDVQFREFEEGKQKYVTYADHLVASTSGQVETEGFRADVGELWHVKSNRCAAYKNNGYLEGDVHLYSENGMEIRCQQLGIDEENRLSFRSLQGGPLVQTVIPYGDEFFTVDCRKLQVPLSKGGDPVVASKDVKICSKKYGEVHAEQARLHWSEEEKQYKPLHLAMDKAVGALNEIGFSTDLFLFAFGVPLKIEMLGSTHIDKAGASLYCEGPVYGEILESTPHYFSSVGKSHFSWAPPGEDPFTIDWKGMMHYNQEENLLSLDDSIHLVHPIAEVKADQAKIKLCDQSCDQILLEGDVLLSHHLKVAGPHHLEPLQYALGDRLIYFPTEKELTLSANYGNRTLVYDNTNGIEMSAPEVMVRLKEDNEVERMQGVGDVRFKFNAKERSLLWNKE